jgi:poly(A) polymerase
MFKWLLNLNKRSGNPVRIYSPHINAEIDPDAKKVVRRLRDHGHTAYIVGGALRDLLLDLKPKDFDVATSAHPYEIKNLFRNAIIIGRRFRLAHIRFKENKIVETATFRKHHGQKEPQVVKRDNVFGTEKEDAFRRDFTMNALFYDTIKQEIIDYTGGLSDLQKKKIQCIGDPKERLIEDPVRVLRAIKFSAKFGLCLGKDLEKNIVQLKKNIKLSSTRRLLEEFIKILREGILEVFILKSLEYDFLNLYLPFLHRMVTEMPGLCFKTLKSCDDYSGKAPVSLPMMFSIILWPLVKINYQRHREMQKAVRLALTEFTNTFPIGKNDKMQIRAALVPIPRFDTLKGLESRKRGYLIKRFIYSPSFKASLGLYKLIEQAERNSNEGYRFWKNMQKPTYEPIHRRKIHVSR